MDMETSKEKSGTKKSLVPVWNKKTFALSYSQIQADKTNDLSKESDTALIL